MLGAFLSIPMYFLWKNYLQPKFRGELDAAWERNWFNRLVWRRVAAGWTKFEAWGREWFVPQSFRDEVACEA